MFYRNHRQSGKKKSVFGGHVKSPQEIRALNKNIRSVEKAELKAFEEHLESNAHHIWDDSSGSSGGDSDSVDKQLTSKEKLMILSRLQLNLNKLLQK